MSKGRDSFVEDSFVEDSFVEDEKKNSEIIGEGSLVGTEEISPSKSSLSSEKSNEGAFSIPLDSALNSINRRKQLLETGKSDIPEEETFAQKIRKAPVTKSGESKIYPAGHFTERAYKVDGEALTRAEFKDKLFDNAFIERLQTGNVQMDYPQDEEIHSLIAKQANAGTRLGDKWDYLKSGLYDVAAGIAGAPNYIKNIISEVTGLDGGFDPNIIGSEMASKELKRLAEEEVEKTRQYEEGFIGSVASGDFVGASDQAFNTVTQSLPISVSAAVSGGAGGLTTLSGIMASSEYAGSDKYEGLSNAQKLLRSTLHGAAEGFGEGITGKILSKNFKLFKEGLRSQVKLASQAGAEATQQVAKNLAEKTSKEFLKEYGIDMLKEGGSEGATELVQMMTDDIMGVQNYELSDYVNNISNSIALGTFGGGVMGLPTATKAAKKFADEKLKKNPDELKQAVAQRVQNGVFTPEQGVVAQTDIESREQAVNSVPPNQVPNTEVVDLVQEKQKLESEKSNLDKVFQEPIDAKIEKIENEIKEKVGIPVEETETEKPVKKMTDELSVDEQLSEFSKSNPEFKKLQEESNKAYREKSKLGAEKIKLIRKGEDTVEIEQRIADATDRMNKAHEASMDLLNKERERIASEKVVMDVKPKEEIKDEPKSFANLSDKLAEDESRTWQQHLEEGEKVFDNNGLKIYKSGDGAYQASFNDKVVLDRIGETGRKLAVQLAEKYGDAKIEDKVNFNFNEPAEIKLKKNPKLEERRKIIPQEVKDRIDEIAANLKKAEEIKELNESQFNESGYELPSGLKERGVETILPKGDDKFDIKLKDGKILPDVLIHKSPKTEAIDNKSILGESEKTQISYDGKVKEVDSDFAQSAQRVRDNLKTGEVGYVKTSDGKVYEISEGSKKAKLITVIKEEAKPEISAEAKVKKEDFPNNPLTYDPDFQKGDKVVSEFDGKEYTIKDIDYEPEAQVYEYILEEGGSLLGNEALNPKTRKPIPPDEPTSKTEPNPEQPIETEPIKKSEPLKEEGSVGGIKHAETAKVREGAGMEEYEGGYAKSERQAIEAAEKFISEGGNVYDVVKKIEKGEKIDLTESAIIGKYFQSLDARIAKEPTDALLQERAKLIELLDKAGTTASEEFSGRKLMFPKEDNLANFLYESSKAKGRELTEAEIKQEKSDYENLKAKKEELEVQLKAEREKYNALVAEKGIHQARAQLKRESKKTHEQHVQDRKKILERSREKLKAIRQQSVAYSSVPFARQVAELKAIAPDVKEYAKDLIGENISKLDDIVTQIYADYKDIIEGITKSDIVDILANVHDEKKQTRAQKANQLHLVKREAELTRKLNEVRKGIESTKDQVKKKVGNARIFELEKKIKEVRRLNRERELTFDQDHLIDKTPEGKALARENYLEKKAKQLQDDLRTGNYAKEAVKEKPLPLSRRARDLQDEVINLEKQIKLKRYNDQQSRLQKGGRVIKKLLRTTRILQTIGDWSVLFRQLNKITLNPFRADVTIKAAVEQAKNTFSEKNFDRFMDKIHKDEQYHDMVDDGIIFNDLNTGTTKNRNEEFQQSYLDGIPVVGAAVRASNRGADSAMNTARFELYKQRRDRLQREGYTRESDPEVYKAMANWVMNLTGRGTQFKFLEQPQMQSVLGNTLYGQRLMASHLNVLNPLRYVDLKYFGDNTKAVFNKGEFKKYDPVRKEAIKDLVGYTTGVVLTGYMLSLAGATVSLDPDEPDFLQVRFGDKVYDLTGGSAAYARTGLRLMQAAWTRQQEMAGNVSKKDAESKANFAWGSTSRFLRNKLAPNTANFVNMFFGENTVGEEFKWTDYLELYPMYSEDTWDAMQEEGVSALGTVLLPNLVGVGYGSYAQKANREGGAEEKIMKMFESPKVQTKEEIKAKVESDIESAKAMREAMENPSPKLKKFLEERGIKTDKK